MTEAITSLQSQSLRLISSKDPIAYQYLSASDNVQQQEFAGYVSMSDEAEAERYAGHIGEDLHEGTEIDELDAAGLSELYGGKPSEYLTGQYLPGTRTD